MDDEGRDGRRGVGLAAAWVWEPDLSPSQRVGNGGGACRGGRVSELWAIHGIWESKHIAYTVPFIALNIPPRDRRNRAKLQNRRQS